MSHQLDVYVHDHCVGLLSDTAEGFVFAYLPEAKPEDLVSLLMPVRAMPYALNRELHPVFLMNLPEGYQKTMLQQRLGKHASITDWGLLEVTGRQQIGRNRVVPHGVKPDAAHTDMDLARLLASPDSQAALLNYIADSRQDGISGVMPKVMGEGDKAALPVDDYILKTGTDEFSGLAINEYLCLQVARAAGLIVPATALSEDGRVLAVERFDSVNGERQGVEDFCSLAGVGPLYKYSESLETVAQLHNEYVSAEHKRASALRLLTLILVNYGTQNGDAHLKNFAMVYTHADDAVLAPVYDIVTTTAYIHDDTPALTIGGRKVWWAGKAFAQFSVRLGLSTADLTATVQRVQCAIDATLPEVHEMIERYPALFREVGKRMIIAWQDGREAIAGGKPKGRPVASVVLQAQKLSDVKEGGKKANPYANTDSAFSTKPRSR